jgi:hypothetical protein
LPESNLIRRLARSAFEHTDKGRPDRRCGEWTGYYRFADTGPSP